MGIVGYFTKSLGLTIHNLSNCLPSGRRNSDEAIPKGSDKTGEIDKPDPVNTGNFCSSLTLKHTGRKLYLFNLPRDFVWLEKFWVLYSIVQMMSCIDVKSMSRIFIWNIYIYIHLMIKMFPISENNLWVSLVKYILPRTIKL